MTFAEALERAQRAHRPDLDKMTREEMRQYVIMLEMRLNDAYVEMVQAPPRGTVIAVDRSGREVGRITNLFLP